MSLVFFCQGCATRFEVPDAMAGKSGRCKHCGHRTTIPKSAPVAAGVRTVAPARRVPVAVGPGPASFTDVGLAPLTAEELAPPPKKAARYLDALGDAEDDKPYVLASPAVKTPVLQPVVPVSQGKVLWRQSLRSLQKPLRWLNSMAYLISVPFLMLILIGTITRSRPLAVLGATATVFLNLGRVVTGLGNLILVPFREGVAQGLLFLVPPLTLLYLANHWDKMKKATMRVVEPILTIGLVVVAFTFIPSLRRSGPAPSLSAEGLVPELRAGAADLKSDIRDKVEAVESKGVGALDPRADGGKKASGSRKSPQSR